MNVQLKLRLNNRFSLTALSVFDNPKLHLVTFSKGLKPLGLNNAMVNKYVFTAIVRGYETETLAVVKPFYCTCKHVITSPSLLPKN